MSSRIAEHLVKACGYFWVHALHSYMLGIKNCCKLNTVP